MNLVERAKNILLTPKTEWPVIATEQGTLSSLLTSYVLPLAAIAPLAAILYGFGTAGSAGSKFFITAACITYISSILSYVITAYVVDLLANSFGSEKNIDKSAQLVAFSSTASWVAGILTIVPAVGYLGSLAGAIYSIYLLYLGIGTMKKTPEDKKVVYMIVVFVVLIATTMIVGAILGALLVAGSVM